ncbi:MAG: cytochrome c [Devosia sp.]
MEHLMRLNRLSLAAAVTIIALGNMVPLHAQDALPAPDPAIASMSPDELVTTRENKMKENGGILRSAAGLTGAAAEEAATTLLQNYVDFIPLFDQRSQTALTNSTLPIAWEDWAGFSALFEQSQQAALAMKTAAEAGDQGAYTQAVETLGGLCGQCHGKYRL